MATQLELTEKNLKLLQDIRNLSKERNKLTGVTDGRGLTQFRFFADKVEQFNRYRDNTSKVFNFLTGKAKRDEKALAESQGIDVEQLRQLQKDNLVQASLKEQFEKQVELQKSLNTNFEKYFDKLSDDQKELLQKDEKKFTELFQTFTQTAANKELTDTQRNNTLTEAIEKVVSNANENTNRVIQGNKQNTQDAIDNENENISDAIDRESIAGRQANTAFGASLVQPTTPIAPEVTVESKDGFSLLEAVGFTKIFDMFGKVFRKGFLSSIVRGSALIFGKGVITKFIFGLTKVLGLALNPVVLGGALLFIFKDEISKLIGMTFRFLGKQLAAAINGFKRFISNIFPFSLFMDENDYLTNDQIKSKQEFEQKQREDIQKLTKPEVKFVDPATLGRNQELVNGEEKISSDLTKLGQNIKQVDMINESALADKASSTFMNVQTNTDNSNNSISNTSTSSTPIRTHDPLINTFRNLA